MRLIAILATLAAGPVGAQGVATEYYAAARMFMIPGGTNDPAAFLEEATSRLAGLTGVWSPVWNIADGEAMFPDLAERLPEFCSQLTFRVAATGSRSFDLVTRNRGEDIPYAVHYQFVGGRTYQRSVDEMEQLERLGLADRDAPSQFMAYLSPAVHGYVEVYQPSANVMVIQPAGSNAEIYVRCP